MIETSINMAQFNYTNLHFFDKHGIELPLALQTNYAVEIQNQYGDNALFYGLMDSITKNITYISRKSGNRFTDKTEEPCIVSIGSSSWSTTATVEKRAVKSSEENEYCVSDITSVRLEEVENIVNSLVFPTVTFSSALAFPRISVDLVETQSIYVLVEDNGVFMKLNECNTEELIDWKNHYKLLFYLNNRQQEEFRFFTVDNNELVWTDKIIFDFNDDSFKANIGFCGKEEGVYEDTMYICLLEDYDPSDPNSGNIYPIGSINLQAEAVGEDERYRTLFQNFGIPDPIKYQEVFANTSLDEGKIDYMKLNENSKKLFLSYSEIFSYLGTYKALINAVNVLGYNEIFFKEWYKEIGKTVPTQGYITYDMKYHSDENANIINNIPIEERISLKKLNWISMVYRINKEMGNLPEDKWGFPQIKEIYDYNNEEIIAKLYYLKKWLEKYIIGLNCKIVDVSGEGIYFERYKIDSYGSIQQVFDWDNEKNLIPSLPTIIYDGDILDYTLRDSSTDIYVSVGLDKSGTIEDYETYHLEDFIDGYFDSDNVYHQRIPEDENNSFVYFGRTFDCLNNFETYEIKATSYGEDFLFGPDYLSNDSAGIRVSNNRIFFNPFDLLTKQKQSAFTLLPFIQIERANIRNIEGNWNNSVKYRINPVLTDDSAESYIIKNLETGETFTSIDYMMLVPPTYVDCSTYTEITSFSGNTVEKDVEYIPTYKSDEIINDTFEKNYTLTVNNRTYGLRYSSHNTMNIPIFSIIGYEIDGNSNFIDTSNEYFLEILDGKMLFNDEQNNRKLILNFNYDENTGEQEVKINTIYTSDEFKIIKYLTNNEEYVYNFIPGNTYSEFVEKYKNDASTSIKYEVTNTIKVNNTGKFNIDVYARDIHNNIFAKNCEEYAYVHLPNFSITTYTNTKNSDNEFNVNGEDASLNMLINNYYDFCIYNNAYMIRNFEKSIDDDNHSLAINYPNYSYSLHKAIGGDYLHFMNIADRYLINALDYQFSTTLDKSYIGYSFVLERAALGNVTRVIEEYDSAALLSMKNDYVRDTTIYDFMTDLHDSGSDLDFTDVNFILFNELGNYPILQTYATMINETALPYINKEDNKYNNSKYRLLIGEYSERSYIWASMTENIIQKLPSYIINNVYEAEPVNIQYPEDDIFEGIDTESLTEQEIQEIEAGAFSYLDLKAEDFVSSYLPIAQDFVSELEKSSISLSCHAISDDDLKNNLSDLETSLTNIINTYDASVLDAIDSSVDLWNYVNDCSSDLYYTLNDTSVNLFIAVRSILCNDNVEDLDQFVEEYVVSILDTSCKIETILSEQDLYSNDTSLGQEIFNSYHDRSTVVGVRMDEATLDDTIISTIIKCVTASLRIKGNNVQDLYKEYVQLLYDNYGDISDAISPIATSGVLNKLINSDIADIKTNVQEIIVDTIHEINEEDYNYMLTDLDAFVQYYTKILFATCSYIGYTLLTYIVTDNTFVNDPNNTLYSSYLGTFRIDVLVDSYEYVIQIARGLYSTVFESSSSSEDSETTNTGDIDIHLALTSEYTLTDEPSYKVYERLIRGLVMNISQNITSYWVTKENPKVEGDILYAVASAIPYDESESDESQEEDTVPKDDYEDDYEGDVTFKGGTLYYVKPFNYQNEGLTFVQVTNEEDTEYDQELKTPKNVIPQLREILEKPYISAYIQPTWRAQINISLITKEAAERLGFDFNEERPEYLCIQYSNSDFTWHFRKGEMIKLIFESLTNNEYVGQSSYEVVGYDTEEQVIIVRGTINNAYIRGERHEVWAQLPREVIESEGLEELYPGTADIAERETQPLIRKYKYREDIEETSYRLPIKRIDNVWYYKVFYFVNGIPRAIETQKIDPQEKVNMYISYAHNAYVDYIMKAEKSFENADGTTDLEIEYNDLNCRKMEFIDDTFVMYSKEFDINEGLAAWMNSYNGNPAIVKNSAYSYTSENGFVPVNITSSTSNIAFSVNFNDLGISEDESYVQWKIYKMMPSDNSRKYMFESYNKVLYLDYAQPGIYDIEANVYDKYGNTATKLFKGAYKVTL